MMRIATGLLAATSLAGLTGVAFAQDNAGPPHGKAQRAALAGKGMDALFTRFDRNGDGVITRDEFPKPERFDPLDTDKDGKLTKEEVRGGVSQLAGRGAQGLATARLKQLDTDGDGKISKTEYEASFAKLDTDGDGFITETELSATLGAARETRAGKDGKEKPREKKGEREKKTETPGNAPTNE
jgi:Ca2+-binding EF-hand superfamily protein